MEEMGALQEQQERPLHYLLDTPEEVWKLIFSFVIESKHVLSSLTRTCMLFRKIIPTLDNIPLKCNVYYASYVKLGEIINEHEEESSKWLLQATRMNASKLIKKLTISGVDLNQPYQHGYTALMTASKTGTLDSLRALIKCGANINLKSDRGYTALMIATCSKRWQVVKILIESGADVNIASNYGITPLIWASRNGNIKMMKLLLRGGASISKTNNLGHDALLCALEASEGEAVSLLRSKGAVPQTPKCRINPLDGIIRYVVYNTRKKSGCIERIKEF